MADRSPRAQEQLEEDAYAAALVVVQRRREASEALPNALKTACWIVALTTPVLLAVQLLMPAESSAQWVAWAFAVAAFSCAALLVARPYVRSARAERHGRVLAERALAPNEDPA